MLTTLGDSVAASGRAVAVREVAIRLVDEQGPRPTGRPDSTSACNVARSSIVPVGIVRARDADQSSVGPDARRDRVDVEPPAVVESEVDDVEVGADGARRLEVGRVVGAQHDRVVARARASDVAVENSAAAAPGVTSTDVRRDTFDGADDARGATGSPRWSP